jgi:hypothetical protein
MTEVRASIALPVDAEQAWRAVMDWTRQGDWIPFTQVRVTSGTGTAVGDRIVARTAIGPVGFDDPMEIVRWDPPNLCEVRHHGRVVRGGGVFTVVPDGEGRSVFHWSEQLDLPFGAVGRAGFALIRPLATAALRFSLRRLARAVTVEPDDSSRGAA